jgi:hypothetical protein
MEFTPSYSQLLYLYALAFSGETPSASRPGLDAARRKPIEYAGLIQRNGEIMELTEAGFRWVENHLNLIPQDARRVGLTERAPLAMASAINNFLRAKGLKLKDLLFPASVSNFVATADPVTPDVEPGTAVVDAPEAEDKLADAIHDAYLKCTGGSSGSWVHLGELRKILDHWEREEVDRTLLRLYRDGRVRFDRVDESKAETRSDQESALMVHDNPRHFVAFLE